MTLALAASTSLDDEVLADLANDKLTDDERKARGFARMCRRSEPGERIIYSSKEYPAHVIVAAITLLRQCGLAAEPAPFTRRRGSACLNDSCVVLLSCQPVVAPQEGVPGYLATMTPNHSQFRV